MASANEAFSNETMETASKSNERSGSTEYQLRKYLLLLATLVTTVTYVTGLNLPGGAWQDTQPGHHLAGDPVLRYADYKRYVSFYYCNATAFAASLVVSLLLLVLNGKNTGWEALLRLVMVLDLLGLMGAYAAGSCRDLFTTIYCTVLVVAVFVYITAAFIFYLVTNQPWLHKEKREQELKKQEGDQDDDGRSTNELHEVLMLLATFAVTITYVAGLNPPGGFWSSSGDGAHHVSDPVLQDHYPSRYRAFYVCNTTAFVASLLIIILLLDKKLSVTMKTSVRFVALYGLIVTALLGLAGAYASGSCREFADTTYVICLIVVVLAYIFLQVAVAKAKNNLVSEWLKKIKGSVSGWLKKIKDSVLERLKKIRDSVSGCIKKIKDSWPLRQPELNQQTRNMNTTREAGEGEGAAAMKKARSLVMLLATLVVSITYQAGLDPPGGLWSKDGDVYKNGDPVLLTTHPTRYKVFFYSNSAAFVASLIVIVMVQSRLPAMMLVPAMILDVFGLITAFAAGSCRDEATSIYVVALAGAVLVYVVIHIVFFTLNGRHHQDAEKLESRREVLLLLAILAATLAYQAGLTPPGGFWSEDDAGAGHRAGFPVLGDYYRPRYRAFFYCNAMSFMTSMALIVLLVNPNLYRPGIRCYALYVCMVAGMFGLMGAYAAGSSRKLKTSVYVLTLVAAVLAFVALEVVVFWVYPHLREPLSKLLLRCCNTQEGQRQTQGRPGSSATCSSTEQGGDTTTKQTMMESQRSLRGSSIAPSPIRESRERDMREYLMLLGVLAASVTYQSGLKPPGGLWQDGDGGGDGHYAGDPILHSINARRYYAFFYSNSTSFMASVVVIILLLPWTLHRHELPLWPIHTAVLLDMLGLLVAYAAGSNRDWKTSRNVIYLTIPVFAYLAACAAAPFICKRRKGKPRSECQTASADGII